MVEFRKHILDNGLTVITHEAWDTPLATVNLLYGVGSRDEDPRRTGFAHLFEHLMFGGTRAVPDFDAVVSSMGGESNAFTNCDYTNYYMTFPADGLSTALRLEADRMTDLDISQKALEVQQKVVTEEFHQRYMNQPYGDVWLLLRPLCYKVHPYRWPTIGADIRHVSEATLDDVKAFHEKHYRPENAILAIAGPVSHDEQLHLAEEAWKAKKNGVPMSGATSKSRSSIAEPPQNEARELRVVRQVPATKVFIAWPMCSHNDPMFRACDLLTDVLANGKSSRMHQHLVMERGIMSEADACISGEEGPGLLVLSGVLSQGISPDEGIAALREEAMRLANEPVSEYELTKVQNKYENTYIYSQYKAADRAMGLCHYTWLGDTDLINREPEEYRRVSVEDLLSAARVVFRPEHENRLYYEAERQDS